MKLIWNLRMRNMTMAFHILKDVPLRSQRLPSEHGTRAFGRELLQLQQRDGEPGQRQSLAGPPLRPSQEKSALTSKSS